MVADLNFRPFFLRLTLCRITNPLDAPMLPAVSAVT